MSEQYDNSNRVALWFNDKREKQTQPHLKGKGETSLPVWASAWFAKDIAPEDAKTLMGIIRRHDESSKLPFISVSMQKIEEKSSPQGGDSGYGQPPSGSTVDNQANKFDDFDDEIIPF